MVSNVRIYYLRMEKDYQCLAYCPRLALELGSCVDGEAHGWAWKPYGWFDPAPRPRDIAHTHFYRRRPCLRMSGAPQERPKARSPYVVRPCYHLHLLHGWRAYHDGFYDYSGVVYSRTSGRRVL